MINITRKLEFDAGHRVHLHESKCNHIHGHRYVVELSVTSPELDSLGRVIDFGVIKEFCGNWIDRYLDHGMILFVDDPLLEIWCKGFAGKQHKCYAMDNNPTAENLSKHLFEVFQDLLDSKECGIEVTKVKLWETPNCWAEYTK